MSPETSINDLYQTFIMNPNKQNQYQIRRMLETDVETVVKIEQITWLDQAWSSQQFLDFVNYPHWKCWILESTHNDTLVFGYGLHYIDNHVSHIANICIDPYQRGHGLGGILLQYMIDYSRRLGASTIELEVNTSNINAYRLYYKYGFRIVRSLPQYYGKYGDAYHMVLAI
ncbi:unnamed protein product [Rotaria sp. Silwood2]|nr:unnamed protein product [Rotaria sp. Silwood2]CAF2821232.1 unnamed protein product [Rotaria sp. Silwood2]CAF3042067.1 unnamed protein product [Rotaria sp. Silwood2]CAF4154641.1 unnamed protein product [Rotaria sp. Silwood2]CAF4182697.1 unnamed protein product [Rotaria sp. Silwood2]